MDAKLRDAKPDPVSIAPSVKIRHDFPAAERVPAHRGLEPAQLKANSSATSGQLPVLAPRAPGTAHCHSAYALHTLHVDVYQRGPEARLTERAARHPGRLPCRCRVGGGFARCPAGADGAGSNIQKHHQHRALSKLGHQRPCGTPDLYGVFMSLSELKLERNLTRSRSSFSATLEPQSSLLHPRVRGVLGRLLGAHSTPPPTPASAQLELCLCSTLCQRHPTPVTGASPSRQLAVSVLFKRHGRPCEPSPGPSAPFDTPFVLTVQCKTARAQWDPPDRGPGQGEAGLCLVGGLGAPLWPAPREGRGGEGGGLLEGAQLAESSSALSVPAGSWVELHFSNGSASSAPASVSMYNGDMEKILLDAQHESGRSSSKSSHCDSPPRSQTPQDTNRVSEADSHSIGEKNSSQSEEDYLERRKEVESILKKNSDWIWDWSSRPENVPPKEFLLRRPRRTAALSMRNTSVMKRGGVCSAEFLKVFLPSLLLSHLLAIGLGIYIGRRLTTSTSTF
ncbi:BCL2/adenovirus E1B 19 kDa protein-interacting protein 3 [Pteropus alecto]|nr:BCL2/adenovirus E1B 19 kDa protein-interacting protein 3 [Pteropus alecto]